MDRLRIEFRNIKCSATDDYGSSDAKEAVAFAMLANELVSGTPGTSRESQGLRTGSHGKDSDGRL
jgi:1,6-anhydro-N-acetylmuramate kinase